MKKRVFSLIVGMIAVLMVSAQSKQPGANFTLLPSGKFIVADSVESTFIVIPFDGMTSQEIYQKLMTNAALVVDNPEKQVSGVEFSVVKVNIKQHLLTDVVLGLPLSCTGTMYYEFQIKDGRVRANAPYVSEPCRYGVSNNICYFSSVTKGYFKKGKLKEKKAAEYNRLVTTTNLIYDIILGLKEVNNKQEDW